MHATLWGKCIQLTFEFTKYLQRFIFLKSNIAKISIFKVQRNLQTPIVILYRRLADTNRINIPKYSKRIYIIIHTPRWAFKLLGSLLTRSTSIFYLVYTFHVGPFPLVFKQYTVLTGFGTPLVLFYIPPNPRRCVAPRNAAKI